MHYFDISALSKRDACFTLGGFFKGDVQSPGVSLLRCELECCSGSYCNNQVPRLLPDSVTVFTPTGKKRKTNKQTNKQPQNLNTGCFTMVGHVVESTSNFVWLLRSFQF